MYVYIFHKNMENHKYIYILSDEPVVLRKNNDDVQL